MVVGPGLGRQDYSSEVFQAVMTENLAILNEQEQEEQKRQEGLDKSTQPSRKISVIFDADALFQIM